jgi:hypothetical protein
MQVELAIDAIGAAPQLPQHGFGNAGSPVAQLVARLDRKLAWSETQAFLENLSFVRPRESRARRRLGARGRMPMTALERRHVPHGLAKELGLGTRLARRVGGRVPALAAIFIRHGFGLVRLKSRRISSIVCAVRAASPTPLPK